MCRFKQISYIVQIQTNPLKKKFDRNKNWNIECMKNIRKLKPRNDGSFAVLNGIKSISDGFKTLYGPMYFFSLCISFHMHKEM